MKISFLKNSFFFLLIVIGFTYCGSDDEMVVTPDPDPDPEPMVIPTATISHEVPAMITEGSQTFNINVSLDEATSESLSIPVSVTGGTATQNEDYSVASSINIAANQTSGSGALTILSDCIEEEEETISLSVGDASATNVNVTAQTISTSIENSVSDEIVLSFDWSGSADFDGTTYQFCDGEDGYVDIDIYLVDSTLSFFIDIDQGATYACPEVITLGPDSIDNGAYFIFAELYFDAFDSTFSHSYPITVTAEKCGGLMESFVQNESLQFTAADEDFSVDMNEEESLTLIAGLVVQDGIYAIVDLESGDPYLVGLRQKEALEKVKRLGKSGLKRRR